MKIKITADSTCDLNEELIKKYDISILPLYVVKDGKSHRDNIDITPQDIISHVRGGGDMVSTSAINTADYIEYWKPFKDDFDAIIHIDISSDFSSCVQNAKIAAEEIGSVYVIDSRNLSSGSGHIVVEAAKMAENGASPEEIVTAMNLLTPKIESSFVIEKLDFLRKGGRCSSVAALGANLLSLRPCIEVVDGKMKVGKKYRGVYEKCIAQYIKERLAGRTDIVTDRIFITHSPCDKQLVDIARKQIEEVMHFDEIIETNAGCTVTSHCGPNTLGILFKRK